MEHKDVIEKLQKKGPAALTDIELTKLIIGKLPNDRKTIYRDVCNAIKNNTAGYEELKKISGFGPAGISRILSTLEYGRRLYSVSDVAKVVRPEDILPLITEYRNKQQEYFICLTLNGAGEVIGNRVITMGLLNHSLVHPREVFADAITDRAASIICVHNHPSGSLEPSSNDIAITRQLSEAGSILGITLIDHIIITKTSHCSMKERGLI